MADRNSPHLVGFISRKFLFCMFTITTFFFIFSWFFVFRSTSQPQFIDHSLLPNSKLFSTLENNEKTQTSVQNEIQSSSIPNPSYNALVRCGSSKVPLKVFMYDMPPEFHFELVGWKAEGDNVWPDIQTKIPDYPGGLNLQHSIEYWLTLDLLSSRFRDPNGVYSAVRVLNSSEADVVFVPFFSSVSYNRHSKVQRPQKKSHNKLLQEKLVSYLTSQEEWKRSGGRDHIVMAHHPNSMLDARMKLWSAMFILSDFGRYPPNVANVEKDVIAPYRHVIRSFVNDSSGFDDRPTLLYFQGAIYRKDGGIIRQELYYLLKDEKDVHFTFGSIQKDGIREASQGMHSSKFCLNIAGDTPSSNRLFDAIASHCVPVIISDEIELPYEDILDYSEFSIFVRRSDAVKEKFLVKLIRSIGKDEWTRMWNKLKEIERFFEYQYPSKQDDAVQMIWQAVARKVPAIKLKLHKLQRFARSDVGRKRNSTSSLPWSKHNS
ncbi:Exostosin-like [Thalictrum thalictroides]|uniref:Exostosin-like n=1 Tax=Thalictrum thalictroides TaxID=46969 RepID=A0A7J6XBH1_THATH|nr:Exostosin-like [Thalictrum thalictroides]